MSVFLEKWILFEDLWILQGVSYEIREEIAPYGVSVNLTCNQFSELS